MYEELYTYLVRFSNLTQAYKPLVLVTKVVHQSLVIQGHWVYQLLLIYLIHFNFIYLREF